MSKFKKKSLAKKITLSLLTTTVWMSLSAVGYAANLPTGGSVVDGDFTNFNGAPTEAITTITQTSSNGVLEWTSFDVGSGYTVNFKQPDVSSMTLNRVTGNDFSTIAGNINANGSIAIVNPNGLIFAEGSTVNAAGIVASTADLDTEAFMDGTLTFKQNKTTSVNGDVTINGTLNAETNNSAVNSMLNLGGVTPATGFSSMNNVIKLVADGNVTVGETGVLTAVTTTNLTEVIDNTVGEEDFTTGEDEASSSASGRIVIRADQNADDVGTVKLENDDASQIQSKSVDIYYNSNISKAEINGTSDANITGDTENVEYYTQKDYRDYAFERAAYKAKIATTITEKENDITTGLNSDKATTTDTSGEVYMLVNNIEQVAAIEDSNYGNLAGQYAQGTDIDASETSNWNSGKGFHPIGSDSEAAYSTLEGSFTGVFNGDGGTNRYNISNLTINRETEDNVGMISTVSGTVRNVRITGTSSIVGNSNVGAIVGSLASGTVRSSSTGSSVNIEGKTDNIGGLVGYSNDGNIYGSRNNANVLGIDNVGGLVGNATNTSNINGVYNAGDITGVENVGGLVGSIDEESKISFSVDAGLVTGELNTGGVVGLVDNTSITSTYNKGIVIGVENTGGIAGSAINGSSLSKVYNTNEGTTLDSAIIEGSTESTTLSTYGQVTGETNTGGLVGYMSDKTVALTGTDSTTIDVAYNAGNITGTDDNTGGLVGYMESGTITNAYNADNNTVIYKEGLLGGGFTYDGVRYVYSTDGTTVTSETLVPVTYDLNNTADVDALEALAPEADRVSYAGLASTTNDDYNGFTYDGVEYTYNHDSGLYTNLSTAATYTLSEAAIVAPVEGRVNNIRLAYRDANVVGTSFVGGIVGKVDSGNISKTYNAGDISTIYTIDETSSTVGAIAGVVAGPTEGSTEEAVTITNSYYVTDEKRVLDASDPTDTLLNISNQTVAFGTNDSSSSIEGITLAAAQSDIGNDTLWGTTNNKDGDTWITYAYETTPLLQTFMTGISINREYDYNGESNKLKTEDIEDFYGAGFFEDSSGAGKDVLSDAEIIDESGSTSLKYERQTASNGITEQSIYTYDDSDLWSPQHGYITSDEATVIINPIELAVDLTGKKVYGQDAVTGASTSNAGTSYDTGYKVTYTGFAYGEDDTVLTGEIKYNFLDQDAIVFGDDENALNAGSYTLPSSNFDDTSLTANHNNYTISYNGTLTVKKADLYIDVDGNRIYGDDNSTGSYTYSANEGTDNNTNDGTLKSFDGDDALDLTGLNGWSHGTINNLESDVNVTHNGTITGTDIINNTDVKGMATSPEAYNLVNGSDLSNGSSSNYNIIFDTANGSEGTFTINPATLKYEVEGERTYGASNTTATGSVLAVESSLKVTDTQSDVLDVDSEEAIAQWMAQDKYLLTETKNAGEYTGETLTATDANAQGISIKSTNNNYVLADNADGFDFTINKASLVFDVDDKTKIYGELNPTLTGDTGSGWVNSESLNNVNDDGLYSDPNITMAYRTNANQQSNVGDYSINTNNATKTAINATTLNENYNITYNTNQLSITKADLDFVATGSSIYGTAPVFDEDQSVSDIKIKAAEDAFTTEAASTDNTEHKLKSWDSAAENDITVLTDFSSTDPITLYTTIDGVKTEIGEVTNVLRDASGNVLSYELVDGSFENASGDIQLATKNYNLHFVPTTNAFEVTPKELTFNVDNKSKTYGSTNPTMTGSFDATGFENDDSITVNSASGLVTAASLNSNGSTVTTIDDATIGTLAYDDSAITQTSNAGTYTDSLGASGFDLTNYDVTYNFGDMQIDKADLNFAINSATKVYGENNPDFSVVEEAGIEGTGWVNGENLNNVNDDGTYSAAGIVLGYETDANQQSDVDSYAINTTDATKTAINATTLNENYNITYTSNDLTITKADLDFIATGSSIYGTAPVFDEDQSVSDIKIKAAEDAFTTEAASTDNTEHKLKSWDSGAQDDITDLTGFESTDPIKLYTTIDGTTKEIGTVTNVLRDASGNVLSYELVDGSFENATGDMQLATKNYNLHFVPTSNAFEVIPKGVTFNVDDKSKTYGSTNPTMTGSFAAGGFENGDSITVNSTSGLVTAASLNSNGSTVTTIDDDTIGTLAYDDSAITQTSNASTYTDSLGASGFDLTNYDVTYNFGDMQINKADLNFSVNSATKVYGENNPGFSVVEELGTDGTTLYEGTGWVNGENLNNVNDNGSYSDPSIVLGYETDANQQSDVDSYAINTTDATKTAINATTLNENYNITYTSNDLTITKADLDFIATGSSIYGTAPVFDEDQSVSDIKIKAAEDAFTTEAASTDNTEHKLKSWDSGAQDDITDLTGFESTDPIKLYTTIDGTTKEIGTVTNVLRDASGNVLSYELVDGSFENATGDMQLATKNYNLHFVPTSNAFEVIPKGVTFNVDDKSKTYGSTNPTMTGSFAAGGFENGDSITVNSTSGLVTAASLNSNGSTVTTIDDDTIGTLAYDDSAITQTSNASTYTDSLGASGFDLTNYDVTYNFGDMQIDKADLTFYVDPKTKIYGDNNPDFDGSTGSGFVNNESLTNVNDNGSYSNPGISMEYSTVATQQSDVGFYDIDVEGDTKSAIAATKLSQNYNITYNTNKLEITKADLDFSATGSSEYGSAPSITDLTLTATNGAYATELESTSNSDGKLKSWDAGSKDDITTLTGFDSTDPITLYTTIDGTPTEIGTVTNVLRDASGNVLSYGLADGSFRDATTGDMQLVTKNYNLNFDGATSDLKVTPKALEFAVDSATREYGADNPTFTGDDGTGWVNGDNLTTINNNGEGKDVNIEMGYETSATGTSNVGTYDITINDQTAISNKLSNYDVTYGTNDLSVTKAQLDFVVGSQSKTYGDANDPLTGQFDSSDFKNGDSITVDSTGAVTAVSLNDNGSTNTNTNIGLGYSASGINEKTNVGTYNGDLTASGVNLENYEVNYTAGDMVIGQKDLTFNIDNPGTRVYGDGNPTFTGDNGDGWVNNESLNNVNDNGSYTTPNITMGYETSATNTSNVGTYGVNTTDATKSAINATTLNENYNITYNTNTLGITKAQLDFVVGSQSKTYGDANDSLTGQFDSADFKNGDSITVDSDGKVTKTILNSNGSITTEEGTDLDIGLGYSANGINSRTNAGTYNGDLTASGVNLENYEVNYTAGDMVIGQKDLTFNIDNPGTRVYGDGNPTFTGDNGDGWVNNESLNNVNDNGSYTTPNITMGYETSATNTSNVGTYGVNTTDATKSAIDATTLNENYNITYNTNNLSVTKAQLDFVVGDQSKTYGDANDPLTGQFDSADFKNGDSITVDSTGAVTAVSLNDNGSTNTNTDIGLGYSASGINEKTNVGTYNGDLTASGVNLENYEVNYTAGDMVIGQKDLTFNIDNPGTRVYGDGNPTFTGDNGDGWVNNESLNNVNDNGSYTTPNITMGYETSATNTSNVGTYGVNTTDATKSAINATTLNENYNITYNTNTLGITKAQLDFVVGSQSKTYGDANDSLTGQFDSADFKNGDSITVDSTGAVTAVSLNDNGSTNTNTDIGLGYSANGINSRTNAGTYNGDLTAIGVNLENYEVNYTAGDMVIGQKDLTFNINPSTREYGDANPTFTGDNGKGWVNGENLNNVNNNGAYTTPGIEMGYETSATETSNVGTYGVNTTGATKSAIDATTLNENYNITYNTNNLSVTKAKLDFVVGDQSKTYGDVNDPLTGQFDSNDFKLNDSITVDATGVVTAVSLNNNGSEVTDTNIGLAYSDNGIDARTNAGTYNGDLTASGVNLENYEVNYTAGDMVIGQKDLVFNINNPAAREYGDDNPTFTGDNGTGWVNGENLNNVNNNGAYTTPGIEMGYETSATETSNVGTYGVNTTDVTKSAIDATTLNENYNITYNTNNLSVTKAQLDFVVGDQSKTYGDVNDPLTGQFDSNDFKNGDSITVDSDGKVTKTILNSNGSITTEEGTDLDIGLGYSANGINSRTNAGTYNGDLTASGVNLENYEVNYTAGDMDIAQKDLVFNINPSTREYGDGNPTFTGDNGDGWVNNESLNNVNDNGSYTTPNITMGYETSATNTSNVGTYGVNTTDATKSAIDATTLNENYNITYNTNNLSVTKAQLDFVVGDQSKTYGDANDPLTGQFDSADFKNGDSITVDSTGAVTAVSLNDNGSTNTNTDIGLGYSASGINEKTNVGTYNGDLTASGVNLENYEVVYTAGDMEIAQKDLVFNINPVAREYGDDNPTFTGDDGTGWVNGENLNNVNDDGDYTTPGIEMGYETSATETSNVGTYGVNTTDATKSAIDATTLNENYNITYNTNDLSVTKAQLDFVVGDQSKTYGDANGDLTGQFDASDFKNGDSITVDSTGAVTDVSLNNNGSEVTDTAIGLGYSANGIDAETNAGSYDEALTASGVNLANYEVVYTAGDMEIAQKDLVFNINNPAAREYGDDNPTFTGDNGTGWVNGENLNNVNDDGDYTTPGIEMGYETSATETSNVGTYGVNTTDATKSAIDATTLNENYNITYNTNNLSVTKAQLDFVVGDQSKTYGDANGDLTGQFDASDFKNGDSITVDSTGAVTDVSLNNNGSEVTDTAIGLGYSANGIDAETNAGSYDEALTASGVNLANYEVVYTAGDMEIAQKDLVFNINPVAREYGDDNPTFTGDDGTGWVNGENLNNVNDDGDYTTPGIEMGYETSATETSNVGTYGVNTTDATKSAIDATTLNENYNITYNTNDLSVTKAQLDFVVGDQSKTYGDANDPLTGQFDANDFKNGDSITVDSTGAVTDVSLNNNGSTVTDTNIGLAYSANGIDKESNAGTYNGDLTASGVNLENYEVNYTAGDMDIAQKDLVFNINPSTREYGDANPTFTGDNGTGWVNGENLNNVNDNGDYTTPGIEMGYETSATETSNVGTYGVNTTDTTKSAIDATTLNENYNITYNTNDLSVTKAQLDFVVDNASKTYGDVNPNLTGSFDTTTNDFKNGDSITVDSEGNVSSVILNNNGSDITSTESTQVIGFDIETNATQYSDANEDYDIKADGFDLTNYEVNYTLAKLDIGKAELIYNVDDLTKEYGEDPTYTGGYDGLKGDNDITNLGGLTPEITGANQQSDVGSYDLEAVFDEDVITNNFKNYDLTTESGKITITPADLYFNAEGEGDYGNVVDVNDFTYSASKGVSDTTDGALKSWDADAESDLSTLEGFTSNGTDDLILLTSDGNGNTTQIGPVTSVKFDSDNNIIGYVLEDGSFTREDGSTQLGSLNYNWIFEGGTYKVIEEPIPAEPEYQDIISIANKMGGYRTPDAIASILYLNVIDNGINVSGNVLNASDYGLNANIDSLGNLGDSDTSNNNEELKTK